MISAHIKEVLNGLGSDKGDGMSREGVGPLISINKLTGKVGGFYEKVRYLVEYKEEHTVRRSAIERVLMRKLRKKDSSLIGMPVLLDLVTGGYLPNNSIAEGSADDVQKIINKYVFLADVGKVKDKFIFSLCATEIERFLFPQTVNDLVVLCFYKTVSDNLTYKDQISKDVLDIETYIACRRSLLDDDNAMLLYATVSKYIPELLKLDINDPKASDVAVRLHDAESSVPKLLEDPLGWRITSQLKDYAISFSVIREIIKNFGASSESIFTDQTQLSSKVKEILNKKYQYQTEISSKSGTRAVIYVLLTKVILALILEVPYERIFLGSLDYFALGTNIVFHPLLLLAIVKTVRPPGADNTNRIISSIDGIVNDKRAKLIHVKPIKMKLGASMMFGFLYLVLVLISFSLVLSILRALNFNVASIVLFLFFLTLVSYFGFRIRYNANKWKVLTNEEGFFALLWNFFTIPIVQTGKWLSVRFATINIFIAIMDFLLETPFRFILGTFDSFISFLKDKKDNPY